ncbi:hypothetical protein ACFPN9_29035 [Bosea massiliensis]|uniref:Uncharacterized protein n=2 Tax=Bosea massiliensis TaxID=151419 RepID=A0ABW0PBN1_9HYPH
MDTFAYTATGAEGVTLAVPGGYLANLAVVSRGGALQAPGDDVDVTSGTNIVFATALVAGESILVYKFRAFSLVDSLTKSQNGADIPSKPAFRANLGIAASPFKNLLINALGTINQRVYVSAAAVGAANTYTLDRWKVVVSGQALSWTESQNVRTMTAPAGGVEQAVEGANIQSGVYTLSWIGTATATVDGAAVVNGGPVTLTGGSNAVVRFIGGTFALPQLERGSVATEFGAVPYDVELLRCTRYCQVIEAGLRADGYNAAGGVIGISVTIHPMRSTPIVEAGGIASSVNASGQFFATSRNNFAVQSNYAATGAAFIQLSGILLTAEI